MKTECLVCAAQLDSVWLCNRHLSQLRSTLRRLPALARDLDTTIAKQDQLTSHVGSSSQGGPKPLIVNLDAVDVKRQLRRTLLQWTHHVYKRNGQHPDAFTITAMARFMNEQLNNMITTQPIGALHTDIQHAARVATNAVDLPPDKAGLQYAGPCGAQFPNNITCMHQLWARPRETSITCQRCGTEWDVDDRRDRALDAAEDILATADTISRALTAQNLTVSAQMIYHWKHRGKLTPAGVNKAGQPVYRVGDVLDILDEIQAKGH